MQRGTRQSQSIFRATNHKSVIRGHVSYPTDSSIATRLELCFSLLEYRYHDLLDEPPLVVSIKLFHYSDVIMSTMSSQITTVSTVCPGADQRKHQSSASLAFVRGIHREPDNSPHKGPVTRKMFPFDDVINEQECLTLVAKFGPFPRIIHVYYTPHDRPPS